MKRAACYLTALLMAAGPATALQTCQDALAQSSGPGTDTLSSMSETGQMSPCAIKVRAATDHDAQAGTDSFGAAAPGGDTCKTETTLTEAKLTPVAPDQNQPAASGDNVEVHWVYASCDLPAGAALGACLSAACDGASVTDVSQDATMIHAATTAIALDSADAGAAPDSPVRPGYDGSGASALTAASASAPSATPEVCFPMQVSLSGHRPVARPDADIVPISGASAVATDTHRAQGARQRVTAMDRFSQTD